MPVKLFTFTFFHCDFAEFLCIFIQSMLDNDTGEIKTCCKTQYIRVSPVQSGQELEQSPVFSSISNFYCRRKFLKVILTREYFDGII